jgi:hypothetical protein
LPLPTYCAQPVTLKSASKAAIGRANFFMNVVPFYAIGYSWTPCASSAEKTHTLNLVVPQSPATSPRRE